MNKISENELISCNKKSTIYYNNDYIDYPFQKNIHQLEKNELIECLFDLNQRNSQSMPHNFKEMLYHKFGTAISNKFLIPYNEKLYATDLTYLDVEAMGRFFPYTNLDEVLDNFKSHNNQSYNDFFLYPKKGSQVFVEALETDILKQNVYLNEEIISIDYINKIVYTSKYQIKYQYLINTIPLNSFTNLINQKEINKYLNHNQVLVFNIGFDKEALDKKIHWIYYPQKDINFYRVGFYNNILQQNKLSIYVEIGLSSNQKPDISSEFNTTLKNLKKVNVIDDHRVIAYQSIMMNPAYVHISNESINAIKNLEKLLNMMNIYILGRYGRWQYCSIEDCILEAKDLATLFNNLESVFESNN